MSGADQQVEARARRLDAGLEALGIAADAEARQRLLDYLAMMVRWNRIHNLTAVRDPLAMVDRHLLDSLAGLPWLPPGRLVDLGTGAGLPGIPIAIMEPDRPVALVDSAVKRTRFLTQVVGSLGLSRVTVHHSRGEDYVPEAPCDVVVARAVTHLDGLVKLAAPMLAEQGSIVAWKGAWPEPEGPPGPDVLVESADRVVVPGEDGERHIVVARPRLC
ncbi:MAG: 16S rRNA (guanine(527)-N(7))-methyltransferase RsmG [Pseudomonadota bacterium]